MCCYTVYTRMYTCTVCIHLDCIMYYDNKVSLAAKFIDDIFFPVTVDHV